MDIEHANSWDLIVKWGKETQNYKLETEKGLDKVRQDFEQMFNVPAAKQKIIYSGVTLKSDQDLSKIKLKQGGILMMMGQAEGNQLQQVKEKTIFVEDLTPEQKAKLLKEKQGVILPAGLSNLGNTCYLNSTLQCLKRINELKEFLQKSNPSGNDQSNQFFRMMKDIMTKLESKGEAFTPQDFVFKLRKMFPRFAEVGSDGQFKQQDADECLQIIISTLFPVSLYNSLEGEQRNLIKDLLEVKLENTLQNQSIKEDVTKSSETNFKLMCIIDNESNPVNTLEEGIAASFQSNLEKKSDFDQIQHLYTKTSKIDNQPNYLMIQMVRFYWKQVEGKEGVKAKILRNVAFPKILDITQFCSEKIQEQIKVGKEYEKKVAEEKSKSNTDRFEIFKQTQDQVANDSRELYKKFKESIKEEEEKEHDTQLYKPLGLGLFNGCYQLIAVLTHKGREADSGHYVAWVHSSGDRWLKYDDDVVSEHSTEDVMNLRGGGDWHMGYYLIYRKIEIQ